MPIVVPPKGTRGAKVPIPRGALGRLMTRTMAFFSRRGMKVQGRPLLAHHGRRAMKLKSSLRAPSSKVATTAGIGSAKPAGLARGI